MTSIIEKAKKLIGPHEGERLKPYKCTSGFLTIGRGRNLDAKGISEEESDYLFENDVKNSIKELEQYIPWHSDLPEKAQLVLIDMAFNLGINGLLGFKKFLSYLKSRDYENASKEMLNSRWANQVGPRAYELSAMIQSSESEIDKLRKRVEMLEKQLALK